MNENGAEWRKKKSYFNWPLLKKNNFNKLKHQPPPYIEEKQKEYHIFASSFH